MAKSKLQTIRIALAPLKTATSVEHGTPKIIGAIRKAAARRVELVCFPETYLPGLRIPSWHVPLDVPNQPRMKAALDQIRAACRAHRVAAIVGVEWVTKRGLENRAVVINQAGRVLGYQTKNQISMGGESVSYVPDGKRRLFKVGPLTFGIAICHEAWRYPETVRWAAVRGAQMVFQPQATGSDLTGRRPKKWGESFYEKAMQCRAGENSIYFASVNLAMKYQNSATSLISPRAELIAAVPYGRELLLVHDLDLSRVSRGYAKRFRPELYPGTRESKAHRGKAFAKFAG